MSVSNKKSKYAVAKLLHWAGVVIIGFNLLSGWRLDSFSLEIKQVLMMIHSGVGTAILFMMLFRWWWRRTHHLYSPPRWWQRPSMVLQWVFYPLVLMQVAIGVGVAAVIDYEVLGLGFIPFSAVAADSESLKDIFLQLHTITAWVLISLVLAHGLERWRLIFVDDSGAASVQQPAKL